jgi:hypothetical protein
MIFKADNNIDNQIDFKVDNQGEIIFAGIQPVVTVNSLGFNDGVDVGSFLYDDGVTAGKLIPQE